MSVDWQPLRAELRIWRREKLTLPLWLRDDDAIEPSAPLNRLIAMAETHGLPVHLAIIPAHATPELAPYLTEGCLRAVVHGWSHQNNAPEGVKRSEFGTPRETAAGDIARGLDRLRDLYGEAVHPMFVPPWNRIDPGLLPILAETGSAAVSTYGSRASKSTDGLQIINTHIDPIEWHGSRSLAPPETIIATLVATLEKRRQGEIDAQEPLGLLTHHLVHDQAIWAFCDALLHELREADFAIFDIQDIVRRP